MFGLFKKKAPVSNKIVIGSPMAGKVVDVKEVPDPTFAEEMLGTGIAVEPTEGKIYAPCDGEVAMVFETKHAVTFTGPKDVEILIHCGLETVTLGGAPFDVKVSAGDKVKKGDLVMTVDLDAIRAAGLPVITPMVICNADDFKGVTKLAGKTAAAGDDVLEIEA